MMIGMAYVLMVFYPLLLSFFGGAIMNMDPTREEHKMQITAGIFNILLLCWLFTAIGYLMDLISKTIQCF